MQSAKLHIKPSLKTIEPHVLEELIKKDLELYPKSTITHMHERMKDVLKDDIQKIVYKLADEGILYKEGSRTDRSYSLAKKKK